MGQGPKEEGQVKERSSAPEQPPLVLVVLDEQGEPEVAYAEEPVRLVVLDLAGCPEHNPDGAEWWLRRCKREARELPEPARAVYLRLAARIAWKRSRVACPACGEAHEFCREPDLW